MDNVALALERNVALERSEWHTSLLFALKLGTAHYS